MEQAIGAVQVRRRIFYGWWIVAVAFLSQSFAVGLAAYSAGNFVKPILADLGGGRFTGMLGITLMNAIMGIASPFLGRALDRRPARVLMAWGAVAFAVGLAGLAASSSAWQAVPALVALGIGGAALGPLAASTIVTRWFSLRRGFALGVSAIGTSFGGFAMSPATAGLIDWLGWRGALYVLAALILVFLLPLVVGVIRDRPADRGLRPDGVDGIDDDVDVVPTPSRINTGALLRDLRFWGIALAVGLTFAPFSGIMTNLVPLATDGGITLARASLLMSCLAGCGIVGKLCFGSIADRIEPSLAFAGAILLAATAQLLLLGEADYARLLVASGLLGLSTGGMLPVQGALIARAFGPDAFGRAMGLMMPVMMPLNLASVPFAGWARDATGSYQLAFQVYLGVFIAALAVLLAARRRLVAG